MRNNEDKNVFNEFLVRVELVELVVLVLVLVGTGYTLEDGIDEVFGVGIADEDADVVVG